MIEKVDADGSGQVEFEEFLTIIKDQDGDDKDADQMTKFFKDLVNGKIGKQGISVQVVINQLKRQKLLDAILCTDGQRRLQG